MDWIDPASLNMDTLPDELRDLCETVAGAQTPAEVAARLVPGWGGARVYIPALRDLRRAALTERARQLFDRAARGGAGNAGEVCRTLGVSRRHLASLLKG